MPLVRLDEEIKKEEKKIPVEQKAIQNVQKKTTEKKNRTKKFYPIIYVAVSVAVFGFGLLVIALINLAIGKGFVI